ncbi:CubicO group peptidase, beta-lactamase class C family [Flavobacterium sp. CF108]|uniref:serine hydrolase domain-containing protein n=1 Tax=unclassified Flavobacterium TaxID=196869 RepID=UPI0008C2A855|nr:MULTISPECIES: serine hydrolase domain-containing protein [unclassified Flavobacterium]SEP17778.1 CubicO group peptidase, beta-lactamase class C family [Flavobacterium sp. fv08]SHH44515.1 CubicO group peptidase, beta-lactamase class C family [Flavobacterium sp. CF108]
MKKSIKLIALYAILSLFTITTFAQDKTKQIEDLLAKYTEYGQFNGSALVAENGKVIFKKGFGLANMEWNIPNQSDTKFRLGSITKQFTAFLIVKLAEEGKIKLDVPITTYLPDYPKENGDKITIHNLLTHTSGIPNYTATPNFLRDKSRNPYSPQDFVKTFDKLPLEFKPGEKFNYSNSGYFLLGYIIEKITGKTYEQYLQETILTPLNLVNTGFDHSEIILKNRAAGYEKQGKNYVNSSFIDMSIPYAAGSLYSTVEDLYLWDQALYGNKILSEKSMESLFKPYIKSWGDESYGYGWSLEDVNIEGKGKLKIIEHGGGINGFNTIISRVPADKNLVVLLNNTGGTVLGEMNEAIRNILYNQPYNQPKKSMALELLDIFKEKGTTAGLDTYKKLKIDPTYGIKEGDMNNAGYQLLQAGKKKEAIEVFKINVEAFPKSGNVYDSLGEAYLADGDKKLALANYSKSVELDPSNENGKKVLEELSKNKAK